MKKHTQTIAIVSDAIYPYNKGGKEKRIYEISTRLAKAGNEVHIFTMKWWKGKENHRVENGVHLHAISPRYALYSGKRRSIRQAVLFSIACLKLARENFDILEVDHMPHLILFSTKAVALFKGKKLYATWNEVWGRKYWNEYLGILGTPAYFVEWLTARLPDRLIAVSEHTKEKLVNDLGIPANKISVVPNGIDLGVIKQTNKAKQTSDIIFAGRLLQNKHVDVLVDAISLVKKDYPRIKTFIVGNGPEKKHLEKQIERLHLEKNVTLLGFLDTHADLYSHFKASKMFVFPSTREGFGIAALEAQACGLPVITTNHDDNATRYLIRNGKNGYVTKLTPQDFANKISRVLSGEIKDTQKQIEKYDWKNLAKQVGEVYNK